MHWYRQLCEKGCFDNDQWDEARVHMMVLPKATDPATIELMCDIVALGNSAPYRHADREVQRHESRKCFVLCGHHACSPTRCFR